MKRIYKLYIAILLAAGLAGTGVAYAQIGGGVGWFNIVQDVMVSGSMQVNNDLTVMDDATFTDQLNSADLTASDDVVVGDDLTVTDDTVLTDDTTVGGDLIYTKQTRIVVTDGSTIAPLGSYQPISSTANTGTSSISGCTSGRLLALVNVGSSTITLTDTGTLKLSGNIALGNMDSLGLLCDGTNWVQRYTSNN